MLVLDDTFPKDTVQHQSFVYAMRHFYHNFVIGDDHNEGKKRMKKNKKEKEEQDDTEKK